MRRALVTSLFALALTLAACAGTPPVPVVIVPEVPPALLSCADEPPVPAGAYTQRDVAVFVLDLAQAGRGCRARLEAVKTILEKTKQETAADGCC